MAIENEMRLEYMEREATYIRFKHVFHTGSSSLECDTTDEENDQYDVRKQCCEIHGLRKNNKRN